MNLYQSIIEPVISLFLPALCIHCHSPLPSGRKAICPACYAELLPVEPAQISRFKQKIKRPHYDDLHILFQFDPLFQELVHLLKYQRFLAIGACFGHSLAKRLCATRYDYITAVPLNAVRFRERGYNQSDVIAKSCAEKLDLEFKPDILRRVRNTKSQTRLNRGQRIENVARAFIINTKVQGKNILIIDDVITTGSTLNECANILKNEAAGRVDIAAIATPTSLLQMDLEYEQDNLKIQ